MIDYLGRKLKLFDLVWDVDNRCFAIIVGYKEIYNNIKSDKVYTVDTVLLMNIIGDSLLEKQRETLVNRYKMYSDMQIMLNTVKTDVGAVYTSNNINGYLYLSLGKSNLYKDGVLINTGYTYITLNTYNKKRKDDLENGVLTSLFDFYNIYPSKSDICFLKHKKSKIVFSKFVNITPIFGESGKYSWICIGQDNTQVNFTLELLEYNKKE